MCYGDHLLWLSIILLIALGLLLSLIVLRKLLGDLYVSALVWLLLVFVVELVMMLLHLFWHDYWLSCGVLSTMNPQLFRIASS